MDMDSVTRASLMARFMAKVDVAPSGCWLWTGCIGVGGYGAFAIGRKPRPAHRVALLLFKHIALGGDRTTHQADHLCRVRRCVNPDHLEMVSAAINVRRAMAVRPERTHCANGHALTDDNVTVYRGHRYCRACHRMHQSKVNARRGYGTRPPLDGIHCRRGHVMAPDNTSIVKSGTGVRRKCRECARMYRAKYRNAKKEAA